MAPAKIWDCVKSCDVEIRRKLAQNIVLVGGNSRFEGYRKRFENELCGARSDLDVEKWISVINGIGGEWSACVGGQILGDLNSFRQAWVTKEEYEEFGTNVAFRKIF